MKKITSWGLFRMSMVSMVLCASTTYVSADVLNVYSLFLNASEYKSLISEADKEIRKLTDNRVSFLFVPPPKMSSSQKTVKLPAHLKQISPVAGLYNLPLLFGSSSEIIAMRKKYDEDLLRLVNDSPGSFQVVGFEFGGGSNLLSSTPVQHPRDFSELQVWRPASILKGGSLIMSPVIGQPVDCPPESVKPFLKSGKINAVTGLYSMIIRTRSQSYFQGKYRLNTPISMFHMPVCTDSTAFKVLSPADQESVRRVLQKLSFDHMGMVEEKNNAGWEKLDARYKYTTNALPLTDKPAWESWRSGQWAEIRKQLDASGQNLGQKLIQASTNL